ncbi:hypothetical protein GWK47_027654 [Chionoecetes opilio]|uniref:Uncharacterized protein n=1 Tax=Chionoecetes opilio TaxID=41210 RepID=A0A8J8WC55_CHIOP|nr:hypothetical protein GWK47_027654 [Chionoecetes opilio]
MLGLVGSSDHHAVLTQIDIGVVRDEAISRTVWLWDKVDWASLRRDMSHTACGTLLRDGADNMSRALTSRLLALQRHHVPHRDYTTKPTDQPWFGYRCRVAAEAKYSAWLRFKRNPTRRNKDLHRATSRRIMVNFAPEKTQAMVVSRSPAAGPAVEGRLRFGGVPLPLQEAVKVLGVEVDRELKFDGHIKYIAKKASHRVSALRMVARFLDRGGKLLLYKAQIRPYLEYAALSWMSCAASHTRRRDSIQRRALRLVDAADPPDPPDPPAQFEPVSPLDSLEHRRDVAALVVFHKAQVQGVPHLAGLRQPPRVATRSTRAVLTSGDAVEVPRSHASQHQRTFVGRVSRMLNIFTAAVPHILEMNTQSVKLAANRWRLLKPTPLRLVIL